MAGVILRATTRWEELYRVEGSRLWRALLLFTGDPELASDVMASRVTRDEFFGDLQ